MARSGVRVLRFAIVATLLVFLIYRLSTQNVDLSSYVSKTTSAFNGNQQQQQPQDLKDPEIPNTAAAAADVEAAVEKAAIEKASTAGTEQSPALGKEHGAPYQRANATFVSLARNSDLYSLIKSIVEVEDRFNHNYHYDWVFFNDQPFDEEFKKITSNIVSGKTHYELIPQEHWSFPEWIDQDRAALVREEMREKKIIYGDSVSYRHMCRFESGFFWQQKIMDNYQYYWRVEPDIQLYCDIDYDLFKYMEDKKLKYGFTLSLYEYIETIPTLWDVTKKFLAEFPQYIAGDSFKDFISDDGGETYNKCHFWSNFEIADLDLWRSDAYRKYFDALDKNGGFFYERWGDAPVHSIAASLFLNKSEVHYFHDVGYYHVPFHNCPTDAAVREKKKCRCNPNDNFTWKGYSCTPRYYKVKDIERPKGWSEQS